MIQRVSSVALCLVLFGGNLSVCAGWAATPEARMACCVRGKSCPMHKGESRNSSEQRVVSQAQADACCAASESQSSQSAPSFITVISTAVLGAGVIVHVPPPAVVATDGWRTVAPIPVGPVPKHVFLSVFLV